MFFKISIILFVLVHYYDVFAQVKKFRFDYKYYTEAQGWFKLHRIPANWREARLRCHFEGAVLASPLYSATLEAMETILWINEIDHIGVFTGIHATFSKGDYYSVEGVPLSSIPITWAPNEPNNKDDDESCLVFHANGTVADANCGRVYPYLCFKNNTHTVLNNCGTTDDEYILEPRTGSCYKFHRRAQPWSRAYMTCAAEGAYLAIINSELESAALKDLLAMHPDSTILSRHKGGALMGFHDWGEHGTWRTIHGQTLQDAGFDRFQDGQPDNATTGEFCGSIFRSGLLNDVRCNINLAFICEKNPFSLIDDSKKRV